MKNRHDFMIALGSNLPSNTGDPVETLRAALVALADSGASIEMVSDFYHTPCFPAGAGPDYVNAAARVAYSGDPGEFLAMLHRVEQQFGRERQERWGQRTLDLDLIAAGSSVLPDLETYIRWRDLPPDQQMAKTPDRLIMPHPRLHDRGFVLVPLHDIAPDWRHPVLNLTVSQMLEALPDADKEQVIRI